MSARDLMILRVRVGALASSYWTVSIMVELMVPIYLICRRLPRRPTTRLRLTATVAALLALAAVPVATGAINGLDVAESFVVFSGLLAVFTGAIMLCYDATPWQALFCATAGYTIQNLQSGITILVRLLVTGHTQTALPEPWDTVMSLGVTIATYAICYLAFIRRINKNDLIVARNPLMVLMFVVVVFMIIGLDLIIKGITISGIPFAYLLLLRLAFAGICVFVLFAEYELLYASRMREVADETERLLAERERQYQLSRANIEAINIKCHDIRHQIRHLAETGTVVDANALASIAREVNVYDSVVETGNEALDTILTEKSLACQGEGIVLSVIADGAALGFMAPSDIYSLFGNVLDNAIEAVRAIQSPEHRSITLNVCRRGAMVAVNCENYCAVEPRFKDGLPETTKADKANHGFGTRSIKGIVERYGGTLHLGAEDGVFYLNALLAG